ncbi:GNAT family N-acetyltransferase [Pontiella sp.]|uniref:GNAT family N-acetyltransferase n=1 Tax=Pontiella sp. TaxID=2837462 RepID=UPI003564025E
MIVREIQPGSAEFAAECALRHRVLREPIGLSLYDEDLEAEKSQLHFGLFDADAELVACVIAVATPPSRAKIRQMAVEPRHQGKGLGSFLLATVEGLLSQRGLTQLSLHARIAATGFYEGLGYAAGGTPFLEVGLPHIAMHKRLDEPPTATTGPRNPPATRRNAG